MQKHINDAAADTIKRQADSESTNSEARPENKINFATNNSESSPNKKKLKAQLRFCQNKIKTQNLKIKKLQAKIRRLTMKIKTMNEILGND